MPDYKFTVVAEKDEDGFYVASVQFLLCPSDFRRRGKAWVGVEGRWPHGAREMPAKGQDRTNKKMISPPSAPFSGSKPVNR